MFSLKKIWGDRNAQAAKTQDDGSLGSIPRRLAPTSRPEVMPPLVVNAGPTDTRAAERFVPRRIPTVLVTDSGKKLPARIINVSATGIAVEADFSQIPSAQIVMVGERRVSPGRKILRGTVFLFEKPLGPSLCTPDFIP